MTKSYLNKILSKRLIILYFVVLLCLFLGFFISPEILINLGIMRKSLTSNILFVKEVAFYEVLFFRILMFLFVISTLMVIFTWKRIEKTAFVNIIKKHSVLTTPRMNQYPSILNKSFVIMLCCVFAGILYIRFGSSMLNYDQFHFINKEDGVIENLSVFFLFLSCVISIILSFKFVELRMRTLFHVFLAFTFFVMIGEEISWGQRVFMLETPELIKKVNVQGEMNFHNLFGYAADHLFIIMVFFVLCGDTVDS